MKEMQKYGLLAILLLTIIQNNCLQITQKPSQIQKQPQPQSSPSQPQPQPLDTSTSTSTPISTPPEPSPKQPQTTLTNIGNSLKQTLDNARSILPDITIEIPKVEVDVDVEKIKGWASWVLDGVIQLGIYVGVGIGVGALVPVIGFLGLYAVGFTLAGVRAGSLAACCQSPTVIANGCFATLQSFGATVKILKLIPVTSVIGGISGLIYLIYLQLSPNPSTLPPPPTPSDLLQSLQSSTTSTLSALTDLVLGIVFGIMVPIGLFLLSLGGQFVVNGFNLCLASPDSVIGVIGIIGKIRRFRKCVMLVPNAGILGGMCGLAYYFVME